MEAEGSAGGLITLWNDEVFKCISCITSNRSIIVSGELVGANRSVVFCNLYAPNNIKERSKFWEYILTVQASLPFPWCIGGDFNTVLASSERIGGPCNPNSLHNFREFILRARVIDIPMRGSNFTWTNSRERSSWAKLDRFLLSPSILSWFPKLSQQCFPRTISDHSAVAIGEPLVDWGPIPFRFFDHWMEDKSMMGDAIDGWKNCAAKGSKGLVLFAKAKAAKLGLKRWISLKRRAGSLTVDIENQMAVLEGKAVREGWTQSLRTERLRLLSELWRQLRIEEQQWRQKSRVRWLTEGDKNTRYFMLCSMSKTEEISSTILFLMG